MKNDIEKEMLEKLDAVVSSYDCHTDREKLHLDADDVLLEALKRAGMKSLVDRYNELRDSDKHYFWYA